MSFEEFMQRIVDELRLYCGQGTEVMRQDVVKVNDSVHHGIVVRAAGGSAEVAPVLYPDRYYEKMVKGGHGFDDILSEIKRDLACENRPDCIEDAADILFSWEKIKERVYPVLLSCERNKLYLEELMADSFLDLRIVYIIRLETSGDTGVIGTVKVTRSMFESFGISTDELYDTAMGNLRSECTGIFRMEDILFHSIQGDADTEPVETMDYDGMYCLCNKTGHYGAACMLLTDVIQSAAKGKNCFIIPSSIHEVLILPDGGSITQELLDGMVNSVNSSEVSENEILSDHAYYFDAESGTIRERK